MTPASPRPRRVTRGFSLLELMVVTVIIAIMATGAVFGIRQSSVQTPLRALSDLDAAITLLQAEALFTGRSFAVSFSRAGWQVLVLPPETVQWQPRDPRLPAASGRWRGSGDLEIRIEGRVIAVRDDPAPQPDVFLLPDGDATPFRVSLEKPGTGLASCTMSGGGALDCAPGARG